MLTTICLDCDCSHQEVKCLNEGTALLEGQPKANQRLVDLLTEPAKAAVKPDKVLMLDSARRFSLGCQAIDTGSDTVTVCAASAAAAADNMDLRVLGLGISCMCYV